MAPHSKIASKVSVTVMAIIAMIEAVLNPDTNPIKERLLIVDR